MQYTVKDTNHSYVKMHNLNAITRKHQTNSNQENIPNTNNCLVFILSVKVMKDKIEDIKEP